jgi:hypothetical protein
VSPTTRKSRGFRLREVTRLFSRAITAYSKSA